MLRNRPPSDRPRCEYCGDVIGVYERFVAVSSDTIARETSRAAEPNLAATPGASWYHKACYQARETP